MISVLLISGTLLMGKVAFAIETLELKIQAVQGPQWRSGEVVLKLDLRDSKVLSLVAHISSLNLPAPFEDARSADIQCPRAERRQSTWTCDEASVVVRFAKRDALTFNASIALDEGRNEWRLQAAQQKFAGGTLQLDLRSHSGQLQIDARIETLDIVNVQRLAALIGQVIPLGATAGKVSGRIQLQQSARKGQAMLDLRIRDLAFSDAQGLRAAEKVSADLRLDAQSDGKRWRFDSAIELSNGLVYIDPLLVEVAAKPVSLLTKGQISNDGAVAITHLEYVDPEFVRFSGKAQFVYQPAFALQELSLHLPQQKVAALYQRYLKPFAGAGLAANLRLEGRLSATLDWMQGAGEAPRIASRVNIDALDLGDSEGQMTMLGMQGQIAWHANHGVEQAISELSWESAQLRALPFGAGAIQMRLQDRQVHLLKPVQLALLDGRVTVERFLGRALGQDEQYMEMQLSLSPISLQQLSDRLAWLPLSGQIAGRIPKLIWSQDSIHVDGDVNMELFDGNARISELSVSNPFSPTSQLHADVQIEGIELGVLSQAFSFGRIDGRLNVRVKDLVLQNWQPISFDAVLATPVDDDSRHRISQRAVDNLASLGGAGAVLSSTFLRFFDEFSYARLGLSCRLQNGICHMDGVAPAKGGYFIVEGGGMPPRVDVMGYNTRVDWKTLLDRLKAVSSSSEVIIK